MSRTDRYDFILWLYRDFPDYMRSPQAKVLFPTSTTSVPLPSWTSILMLYNLNLNPIINEEINLLIHDYMEYLRNSDLETLFTKLNGKQQLLDYIEKGILPASDFLEANENLVEKIKERQEEEALARQRETERAQQEYEESLALMQRMLLSNSSNVISTAIKAANTFTRDIKYLIFVDADNVEGNFRDLYNNYLQSRNKSFYFFYFKRYDKITAAPKEDHITVIPTYTLNKDAADNLISLVSGVLHDYLSNRLDITIVYFTDDRFVEEISQALSRDHRNTLIITKSTYKSMYRYL